MDNQGSAGIWGKFSKWKKDPTTTKKTKARKPQKKSAAQGEETVTSLEKSKNIAFMKQERDYEKKI